MWSLADNDLLELLHLFLLVVVGQLVEDFISGFRLHVTVVVEALTSDSASQIEVFLHDCNSWSMNGAQVGIFEETSQIALSGFLKCKEGLRLESELSIDTVTDCSDESLEWSFSEHEGNGLLVSLYFSEGNSSGSESSGFLDSSLSSGSLLLHLFSLASFWANGDTWLGASLLLFLSGNLLSWHFKYVF